MIGNVKKERQGKKILKKREINYFKKAGDGNGIVAKKNEVFYPKDWSVAEWRKARCFLQKTFLHIKGNQLITQINKSTEKR